GAKTVPTHKSVAQTFGCGASFDPDHAFVRVLDAIARRAAARRGGRAVDRRSHPGAIGTIDSGERAGGVAAQLFRGDAVQVAGACTGIDEAVDALWRTLQLVDHARQQAGDLLAPLEQPSTAAFLACITSAVDALNDAAAMEQKGQNQQKSLGDAP